MKKGFTLTELLGVIVVISILAVIIGFGVSSSINKSRIASAKVQENTLIDATKAYLIDNPNTTAGSCVEFKNLSTNGYVDDDLKNPMTNKQYKDGTCVMINKSSDNKYDYEVCYASGDKGYDKDSSVTSCVDDSNLYVSKDGSDETGNGSMTMPYATLNKAYEKASSKATIYLLSDIEQTSRLVMSSDKKITIPSYNGSYIVKRADSYDTSKPHMIQISSGTLTLKNIILDGNKDKFSGNFATIKVQNGTTVNMGASTVIQNCPTAGDGAYNAAISIENGTFNMSAGTIKDGSAAVYITKGTFNMSGGTISGNSTPAGGTAVFLNEGTTFNMSGGTITNNVSRDGAVWSNGTIKMSGGKISENKAVVTTEEEKGYMRAGGIYISGEKNAKFIFTGGTVTENTGSADNNGYLVNNITIETIVDSTAVVNSLQDKITNPNVTFSTDKKYKLVSKLTENMNLDVYNLGDADGTNIELHTYNGSNAQKIVPKVTVINEDKVYYHITFPYIRGNSCMDADGWGTTDGTNIQLWTCKDGTNQQFYFVDAGDGYYYIKPRYANLCLDVSGGNTADATNVQLWTCNDTNGQKWKFVEF